MDANVSLDFSPLNGGAVRVYRQSLRQTQAQFWGQLGVTQSGGARYEGGRVMPRPVLALVRVVHPALSEAKRKYRIKK